MSFFPVRDKTKGVQVFDCSTCGLDKNYSSPKDKGFGNKNANILIIDEFPTKRIFLLEKVLKQFKIDLNRDCFVTNVVRCKTPGISPPTVKQMKCCAKYLEQDIEQVNPKIIILLGSIPCKAILGNGTITKYRGSVIPFKKYNCFVLPTYDLKKVIDDSLEYKATFSDDLERINDFKNEKPEFINFENGNTVLDDFDDVISTLRNIRKNEIKFALDWETYGLRPYNKDSIIVSCGIAIGNDESYTFLVEDAWKEKQFELLKIEFQKLFTSKCIKTFFNYKFEKDWAVNRLGADITGAIRDIMLAAYVENETTGTHNLEFQALVNFGIGKIKEADKYKKDMRKCPKPLLHDYNGRDARLTYALEAYNWPNLDKRQKGIYDTLLLPGTEALLASEIEGVLISPVTKEKIRKKIVKKQDKAIKKLSVILAHKRLIGEWDGSDNATEGIIALLNSTSQVANFLFTVLGVKSIKKTPKGADCVDKEVLEYYKDTQPFCAALLEYRDLAKLLSTYVDGLEDVIYDDGLLHPSFNVHLTETGRLSGSNPNMQNIPKRKNDFVREMFCAPKGHIIMALDYSGAEVRCMAMESKDNNLVKYIKDKYDMHQFWADRIQKVTGRETSRYEGKNGFVFPSFYGASFKSIAKVLGVDVDLMKQLQKELFEEFPGMKKWQEKVKKFYSKNGYVESLLGRRRHSPLSPNQIINSPIQSLASDFNLLSLIETKKLGYRMCWTIHDDISFYISEDKLEESYNKVREIMTGWDFPFINVPLEVDCSVGSNWYDLIPIEEILGD